jgi:hypothetical protein
MRQIKHQHNIKSTHQTYITYTRNSIKKKHEYEEKRKSKHEQYVKKD